MQYIARTFSSVSHFFADAGEFLYAHEEMNSLMIGLLEGRTGAWLVTVSDGNQIVLAAAHLRSKPLSLILAGNHMGAAVFLCEAVIQDGLQIEGVLGQIETSARCAEILAAHYGRKTQILMQQKIYRCGKLAHPPVVAGTVRLAEESDYDLIVNWREAFRRESLPHETVNRSMIELEARSAIDNKDMYFWMLEGRPVASAQVGRPTARTMSVKFVYTDPPFRRKGIAAALTAHVTDFIFRSGKKYAVLYTDATNRATNELYMRLGYELIADSRYIGC